MRSVASISKVNGPLMVLNSLRGRLRPPEDDLGLDGYAARATISTQGDVGRDLGIGPSATHVLDTISWAVERQLNRRLVQRDVNESRSVHRRISDGESLGANGIYVIRDHQGIGGCTQLGWACAP